MKHHFVQRIAAVFFLLFSMLPAQAQQNHIILNLGMVDGIALSKSNLFDYQIISSLGSSRTATLSAQIKYRNTPYRIQYTMDMTVQPGMNTIKDLASRAHFTYSSGTLKELFEQYGKLPEGVYEYCVTLTVNNGSVEAGKETYEECIYGRENDVFLINLVDPEDKARLYEYHPMLSWVVNYPFAASLNYKLKVVELKEGQNAVNAVKRNNPVYEEKGLMQMSQVYPVYAKPLELNHTYAWTVDAYFRDILLGGAEAWTFTIVEDSLLKGIPKEVAYYDFAKHQGETRLYAIDSIKLKYQSYYANDSMRYRIVNDKGNEILAGYFNCKSGLNYWNLDLTEKGRLKHAKSYFIHLTDRNQKQYTVPFIYVNALYLNK